MATLKIELNDELYKDLKDSNINVQEKSKIICKTFWMMVTQLFQHLKPKKE